MHLVYRGQFSKLLQARPAPACQVLQACGAHSRLQATLAENAACEGLHARCPHGHSRWRMDCGRLCRALPRRRLKCGTHYMLHLARPCSTLIASSCRRWAPRTTPMRARSTLGAELALPAALRRAVRHAMQRRAARLVGQQSAMQPCLPPRPLHHQACYVLYTKSCCTAAAAAASKLAHARTPPCPPTRPHRVCPCLPGLAASRHSCGRRGSPSPRKGATCRSLMPAATTAREGRLHFCQPRPRLGQAAPLLSWSWPNAPSSMLGPATRYSLASYKSFQTVVNFNDQRTGA